jgi:hypothetical protein
MKLPSAVRNTYDLKSKDYYQKMMNRVKEIESTSQGQDHQRRKEAYNLHMKRLSVNKSVIDAYKDIDNSANRGGIIGAPVNKLQGVSEQSHSRNVSDKYKSIRTSSL